MNEKWNIIKKVQVAYSRSTLLTREALREAPCFDSFALRKPSIDRRRNGPAIAATKSRRVKMDGEE